MTTAPITNTEPVSVVGKMHENNGRYLIAVTSDYTDDLRRIKSKRVLVTSVAASVTNKSEKYKMTQNCETMRADTIRDIAALRQEFATFKASIGGADMTTLKADVIELSSKFDKVIVALSTGTAQAGHMLSRGLQSGGQSREELQAMLPHKIAVTPLGAIADEIAANAGVDVKNPREWRAFCGLDAVKSK